MTHSRSWDMKIGRPEVENVTLGVCPHVTFSTLGSSYFHVPLTTVRHLLNVTGYLQKHFHYMMQLKEHSRMPSHSYQHSVGN